jgi:hypothetical protein
VKLTAVAKKDELNRHSISMELRNRVRYRLSADAAFTWQGPQQNRLLGEGKTRDISVGGAFIFTRTCPPIGARIDLDIFLPLDQPSGARIIEIKTEATVIRVEHAPAGEGFAAISHDFELLFDGDRGDQQE